MHGLLRLVSWWRDNGADLDCYSIDPERDIHPEICTGLSLTFGFSVQYNSDVVNAYKATNLH